MEKVDSLPKRIREAVNEYGFDPNILTYYKDGYGEEEIVNFLKISAEDRQFVFEMTVKDAHDRNKSYTSGRRRNACG